MEQYRYSWRTIGQTKAALRRLWPTFDLNSNLLYLLPTDFQTERLYVERHTAANMIAWLPFFQIKKNLTYLGLDENRSAEELCESWSQRQRDRYQEGHGALLFRDKSSDEVIGNAGLLLKEVDDEPIIEIGYSLLAEHQGKGYGIEMAKAIRDYAFRETSAQMLYSTIDPANKASIRVAEKNGMKAGRSTYIRGFAVRLWSIRREEWIKMEYSE